MPDRYIRAALLKSEAWNGLSSAEAQLFFIRLLLLVDDFGCFDGRDNVIANEVFPAAALGDEDRAGISEMLHELHRAGMIIRYTNAGKHFIAITQWGNDLRGNRKFPAPPIDVDVDGVNLRGKFGKDIGWQNPPGFDLATPSVLLGVDHRPVIPQPPEWRPPDHLVPNPKSKVGWRKGKATSNTLPVTDVDQIQAASDTLPVTGGLSLQGDPPSNTPLVTGRPEVRKCGSEEVKNVVAGVVVAGERDGAAPPVTTHQTTSTTPTNGNLIEYREGRFVGLTEEQRVKWQTMFDELRIPDQVDRAAAWLEQHHDERNAIERQGLGFGQFIVRWLLREARSPRTGRPS